MKKVYIAGPYAAKTECQKRKNIDQARDAAAELYRKGWAPFCPHTMTAHFEFIFPDIEKKTYLETDLAWLECCDAIYLLKGWQDSPGARAEYAAAQKLGLAVYWWSGGVPVAKPPEAGGGEVSQNPANPYVEFRESEAVRDAINHPPYYTQGKMECIQAIEGLGLPFHEAQVLKYLVRWRSKGGVEDLEKARWYLDRLIYQSDPLGAIHRPQGGDTNEKQNL